jgi:hypothetical protein
MKYVVTLGGGTGQHAVPSALRLIQPTLELHFTAIPASTDSAGSSGLLRIEHRIIAAATLRNAWLLGKRRFCNGRVQGDTLRNYLVFAALQYYAAEEPVATVADFFELERMLDRLFA